MHATHLRFRLLGLFLEDDPCFLIGLHLVKQERQPASKGTYLQEGIRVPRQQPPVTWWKADLASKRSNGAKGKQKSAHWDTLSTKSMYIYNELNGEG